MWSTISSKPKQALNTRDWKVLKSTWHRDLIIKIQWLVGGWTNPFEQYARQIGSPPQEVVNIKSIWNHHLDEQFRMGKKHTHYLRSGTKKQWSIDEICPSWQQAANMTISELAPNPTGNTWSKSNIGKHIVSYYVFFNKQIRSQQSCTLLAYQNWSPSLQQKHQGRSKVHVLSIWVVQRMALQLLITVEFESLKNITRESKRKWWKHDVDTLPETNIGMEYPPFWWYWPGKKWWFSWAMLLVSGRVSHVDSVHASNKKYQTSESSKFCWIKPPLNIYFQNNSVTLGLLQNFWTKLSQTIFLWCLQNQTKPTWQFFVPFWGWLSDHLERLSDLQLGNQKVTLNHLV